MENNRVRNLIEDGVDSCQRSDFNRARTALEQAARLLGDPSQLPARALAAYGLALVSTENQRAAAAINFCKAALKKDFVDGDVYLSTARTYLKAGSRKKAVEAVKKGLKAEPEHAGLKRLEREMGVRQSPPLSFLPRGHGLNRFLGKMKHAIVRPR